MKFIMRYPYDMRYNNYESILRYMKLHDLKSRLSKREPDSLRQKK
jgi:transposase